MSYAESLLAEGEVIILERRQHWFALVDRAKWGIAALVVAIVLLFLGAGREGILGQLLGYGSVILLIVGVVWIPWAYYQWANDEDVLTNRRVIQVEGVINKRAIDSSLEKINDAVLTQSWVGRLFGFGELDVLTAADSGISRMRMLPNAPGFKKAMIEAKHELELELSRGAMPAPPLRVAPPPAPAAPAAPAGGRSMAPDEVTDTLERLADLRDRGAISAEEYESKKAELLGRL